MTRSETQCHIRALIEQGKDLHELKSKSEYAEELGRSVWYINKAVNDCSVWTIGDLRRIGELANIKLTVILTFFE